jgi:hypothetical protein
MVGVDLGVTTFCGKVSFDPIATHRFDDCHATPKWLYEVAADVAVDDDVAVVDDAAHPDWKCHYLFGSYYLASSDDVVAVAVSAFASVAPVDPYRSSLLTNNY